MLKKGIAKQIILRPIFISPIYLLLIILDARFLCKHDEWSESTAARPVKTYIIQNNQILTHRSREKSPYQFTANSL